MVVAELLAEVVRVVEGDVNADVDGVVVEMDVTVVLLVV